MSAAAVRPVGHEGVSSRQEVSENRSGGGDSRYDKRSSRKLGEGTYGVVYKAYDKQNMCDVAMKKVKMDAWNEGVPTTALREISVLKEVRHRNIVALVDVFVTANNSLYLVFELLDRDLKNCLDLVKPMMMVDPRASTASAASFAMPKYVGGGLPRAVVKWYTYSMLAGIQACHEARILHRDIKPQNILLNAAGDLKIADFGLARTYAIPLRPYTHEVVTLWYRAPEILLGETTYSPAVDVWSIGCIMPEMASGRALFEGDSEIDQIHRVFRVLGHPTEEQWRGVSKMTDYRRNMPSFRPQDVSQWAGHIDETGRDLLLRMLEYDPAKRISAADALRHPYFDDIAAVEVEARAAIAAAVAVEQAEAAAANRERADARERARAGE